jgi:hypothetical protein
MFPDPLQISKISIGYPLLAVVILPGIKPPQISKARWVKS